MSGGAPMRTVATNPRLLGWLRTYRRDDLAGDVGAGIVVAMMMIPQGMGRWRSSR